MEHSIGRVSRLIRNAILISPPPSPADRFYDRLHVNAGENMGNREFYY